MVLGVHLPRVLGRLAPLLGCIPLDLSLLAPVLCELPLLFCSCAGFARHMSLLHHGRQPRGRVPWPWWAFPLGTRKPTSILPRRRNGRQGATLRDRRKR